MKQADVYETTSVFNTSSENIFDSWTMPELMKCWMYSGNTNDIVQVIATAEPNGEFCVLKKEAEQDLVDYCGHYNEVSRPGLLSFSLESPLRFTGISSIVLRLAPTDEGCRMDFLQTGVDPAIVQPIWENMFANLERLFRERA